MENKYYVYRHVRLDKNEVFYVGIGTKPSIYNGHRTEYSRAYQKGLTNRPNKYWHNIVNLTPYTVEIIFESDNYDEAVNKEIEFIKLYGRRDLDEGTLVNFASGGRGPVGYKPTKETIEKYAEAAKNKKKRVVFAYDVYGNYIDTFTSSRNAEKVLGVSRSNIDRIIRGEIKSVKGFTFKKQFEGAKITDISKKCGKGNRAIRPLIAVSEDETIIFDSFKDASLFFNVPKSTISVQFLRKGKSVINKFTLTKYEFDLESQESQPE